MRCALAGVATTVAVMFVNWILYMEIGCLGASVCCGIVVGCTIKILQEIRKIGVKNAAEDDK